jgi:NDP-sugar pyrophosphorylase family protein
MGTTLVILAAGVGSRYGGLKQLEPVGPSGETLLEYSIFDGLRAGFERVVLVVRPETEDRFRDHLEVRLPAAIHPTFAQQTTSLGADGIDLPVPRAKPWGTGQAVLATEGLIRDPFAVINADDFYSLSAFAILRRFLEGASQRDRPVFALAGFELGPTLSGAGPVSRGLCHVQSDGWLERIVEVPELSVHSRGACYTDDDGIEHVVAGDTLVSMNMWGFTTAVFDQLRSRFRRFLAEARASHEESAEFLIPDAAQGMIADGSVQVRVLRHDGQWCGITFPEDRPRVRDFIARRVAAGDYPGRLWG